jgi:hypothetical protein
MPPGAEILYVGPSPGFRFEAAGPWPVTARWSHFDAGSGSFCTASAETTLSVEAARRLRYIPARPRRGSIATLEWRMRIGENADLRPVELRLRGVRRPRLPRRSTPVQTLTFSLRRGDRGRWWGQPERVLRSAGWRFAAGFRDKNESSSRCGRSAAGVGASVSTWSWCRRAGGSAAHERWAGAATSCVATGPSAELSPDGRY